MITEGDKNTILGIKLQFQIGVGFLVRQIQSQGFGGLSQNICTVHRYVVMVNILRKGLDTVESLSAGEARDPNRNIGTVIIIYIFVTFTNLTLY